MVFEQIGCLDWLLTVTVYTKQTTGCPWWDRGASDPLILPYMFSLVSACRYYLPSRQSQRCMQLLSLCAHTGRWTGLDRTGLDWALPRLLPPKG